jgi:hypothetical protein
MDPSSRGHARITLLTDFGTADGYVAAMRGVIASLAPDAIVDDASHEIERGDIEAGAWVLSHYWRVYPAGTIHVAVVDPGVGTERRGLVATSEGRTFVAPDNGILTRVLELSGESVVREIRERAFTRQEVSATFHGRDVFAPAAAHLSLGISPDRFGPLVADPVRLALARPQRSGSSARGDIVHIDRFGNLITNIPASWASPEHRFRVKGTEGIPFRETYGHASPRELFALVGSAGTVEISVRDGSAANRLAAGRGTVVLLDAGHG